MEPLCRELGITVSELLAGRKMRPQQREQEAEKMLFDSLKASQLFGFQAVLYLLQFMAATFVYLPFLIDRDGLFPGLTPVNILCWISCLVTVGCVCYLNRKLPARKLRASNSLLEGMAGGIYFLFLMFFNFAITGSWEAMLEGFDLKERIQIGITVLICLAAIVAGRISQARRRRKEGKR